MLKINQFQLSVPFDKETSLLTCSANQLTGFYKKYKIELKCFNGNALVV